MKIREKLVVDCARTLRFSSTQSADAGKHISIIIEFLKSNVSSLQDFGGCGQWTSLMQSRELRDREKTVA